MKAGKTVILSALALALAAVQSFAAAAPGYHLLKEVTLGGAGGWDYLTVDAAARRVYISHGTHVVVVDADTYAVVGDIPDTLGVHGIALAGAQGFISAGKADSVVVFDTTTLKAVSTVPAGKNPDCLIYDPASAMAFAFNGKSHDATAISAAALKAQPPLALPGKPEFAVADGNGHVYVNMEDKGAIAVIDSLKAAVTAQWNIAPCESPSGLAMDGANRRLFAACDNKMMAVVDADTGRVVATLPTGDETDAAAFDPGSGLAFSSNGEGTLTVIREDSADKFSVAENIPTREGARTMALDTKTHNVFLVTAKFKEADAKDANGHQRPQAIPGTFSLLVYGPAAAPAEQK
jgi:DNA-binding beta-propeller fold protein YncE